MFTVVLPEWIRGWFRASLAGREDEPDLQRIPSPLSEQVQAQILRLETPLAHRQAVQAAIQTAVHLWQRDPDRCNGLVLLTHPVEPGQAWLQGLEESPLAAQASVKLLPWKNRPADPLTLRETLQEALQLQPRDWGVIPVLETCFLRCIGGLDGIEWLRDQVYRYRSRFWLLSCNCWAWLYLDRVLGLGSYFEQVVEIPPLTGEELSHWFKPVLETDSLKALFREGSLEPDWETWATVSVGIPSVAAQMGLQALRQQEDETLTWVKPTLPALELKDGEEDYLLYALLLHRELTLAHLAHTLGTSESTVQGQVQQLLQRGLIRRQQGSLALQPIHYPRLCAALHNRNFLVGEL